MIWWLSRSTRSAANSPDCHFQPFPDEGEICHCRLGSVLPLRWPKSLEIGPKEIGFSIISATLREALQERKIDLIEACWA